MTGSNYYVVTSEVISSEEAARPRPTTWPNVVTEPIRVLQGPYNFRQTSDGYHSGNSSCNAMKCFT